MKRQINKIMWIWSQVGIGLLLIVLLTPLLPFYLTDKFAHKRVKRED